MPLRNTEDAFGGVSKTLHWVIAALILLAYVLVYAGVWFYVERTPPRRFFLRSHGLVGVAVGVLVLFRVYWSVTNVRPVLESAGRIQRALANAAHWTLYALIIAVPLTGWMGTKQIGLFGIHPPSFYQTPAYDVVVTQWLALDWEDWEAIVDYWHKKVLGPYALPLVVGLHVLAALYHHFILRDRTLRRMLFGRAGPRA